MIKGKIFLYKFFILIFECKNLKIFIFSIWTCSIFSYLFFELTYLSWNSFHSVENKGQIALKLRKARKRHVNHFLHFRSSFILHSNPMKTNVSNEISKYSIYRVGRLILFLFLYFTQWLLQKILILINWQNININKVFNKFLQFYNFISRNIIIERSLFKIIILLSFLK